MKRVFALLLALCLCLSALPGFAAAADGHTVQRSPQALRVNGAERDCERYNIDGYNYFKLRDVACLLTGTRAQFDVGWSELFNLVFLFPGDAYTPVAGDLEYKSLKNGQKVRLGIRDIMVFEDDGLLEQLLKIQT